MFETFNVPAFYLARRPVMALYGAGRTSGLVVQCGASTTWITAVYEGVPLKWQRFDSISGSKIDDELRTTHNSLPIRIIQDLKHQACFVAPSRDLQAAMASIPDTEYQWRDESLKLGMECCQAVETVYFPPGGQGLPQAILSTVNQVQNPRMRSYFLRTIVLCGGCALLPGLEPRLKRELQALVPDAELCIQVPDDPTAVVFQGASKLCSMGIFQKLWITKEEYDEIGPAIVHTKCP
jgi:actin-related protein